MVDFNPKHEILEGVDVVWQIPPNPKAVLFLAHSMNGNPFSYWPSHPNVPQCTGTPEHKLVTRDALQRGFAVIAGTSVTNEWETWPPSNVDVQNVANILKSWTREHGLEDLPLSAWGTSCGGDFVSTLAHEVKMHSLIVMISHGHPEAFEAAVPGEYPATLFVPMINDEKTFASVKENVERLRGKGISCAIQEAPPLEVHPHFFAENIDELDKDQSAKLHALFSEHGIVGEDNSLKRVLMRHEVEPYLRKTGILPTVGDLQRQQDEDKLKVQAEGGGGRGPGVRGGHPGRGRGGRGGRDGVRGPPSARGEGPPSGGRGLPPSLRGESAPGDGGEAFQSGGRGLPPSLRGESAPADGDEAPQSGGRGLPPSLRGESPASEGRGLPPSQRGESAPGDGGEAPQSGGRGLPPSLRGESPASEGRGLPPSQRGESAPGNGGEALQSGGRGLPPSLRGEFAPGDGGEAPQSGGRGLPPSLRGESPPAGGGEAPKSGGTGPPPSQRGEAPPSGRGQPLSPGEGPPGGGRGGGGPKRGGPPPSHPLASGISNQLMVAQGNHTLTARHNTVVFAWLEGKGWPNVQVQ